MTFIQLEELGIGLNAGISWEEALHSALMPVTPQASMGSLADSKLMTVNSQLLIVNGQLVAVYSQCSVFQ